jgi:hypothetical protein
MLTKMPQKALAKTHRTNFVRIAQANIQVCLPCTSIVFGCLSLVYACLLLVYRFA